MQEPEPEHGGHPVAAPDDVPAPA